MRVGVIHPDSGWVLSTIAQRMCTALPETFTEWTFKRLQAADPKAVHMTDAWLAWDLQNCWVPELKLALPRAKHVAAFTHLDKDDDASMQDHWHGPVGPDGVIHMCQRYYDRFVANGWYRQDQMTVLRPGEPCADVGLEPVRLGIVQRGGHVGKGGEFLPAVLEALPDDIKAGLELHICGGGWLDDGADVSHWDGEEASGTLVGVHFEGYEESFYAQMPHFYDYLLIPSLWEGGPLALLEALAAGKPVIAPDVGWVPDMMNESLASWWHYKVGDVASLGAVLTELVMRRKRRRALVEGMTYRKYAEDVLAFIEGLEVAR